MTPNINKRVVREELASAIASSFGSNSATYQIGWKNYWTVAQCFDLQTLFTLSSGAAAQDGLWRLVTRLTVVGGGKQYVTVLSRDMRMPGWHNRLRMQAHHALSKAPDINTSTAPTSKVLHVPIWMIYTPNPINSDGSINWRGVEASIAPSQDFAINVTWAANSVIGTAGITATSACQIVVTNVGVVPDGDEQLSAYYPQWLYNSFTPTQTGGNLSVVNPLPTNGHYSRIAGMTLKGSTTNQADVRVDGDALNCISHIGILDANNRPVLNFGLANHSIQIQSTFQQADDNSFQVSQGYTLSPGTSTLIVTRNAGLFMFDLRDITQHDAAPGLAKVSDAMFGVNAVGKVLNGLQVGMSVDSTSNVDVEFAWEMYLPYQGSTAPIVQTTLDVPQITPAAPAAA